MNDKEYLLLLAKKIAGKSSSEKEKAIVNLSTYDRKYVLEQIERLEMNVRSHKKYPRF